MSSTGVQNKISFLMLKRLKVKSYSLDNLEKGIRFYET